MEWTERDGEKALEKMYTRASCRSFAQRDIPEDTLRRLLETALCAASGGNLQPVSIIKITKKEDKEKICKACGNQKFIEQASVNLLFLLDWYKMSVFAADQNAPYKCDERITHFLIGLEDVICAAQSVETAAHFMGIGSCYVGTTIYCADELAEMYNLPRHTYPVVMLSLGYPAVELSVRKKLDHDIMVFEDRYPNLSTEYICEKYNEKYGRASMRLPTNEAYRNEMLQRFEAALMTTYTADKTKEIVEAADKAGEINETQRRFGLHYNAQESRDLSIKIIDLIVKQGLDFFERG